MDDADKPVDFGPSFCGVFAEEPIKKGFPIAEYVGQIFSTDSLRGPNVDMTYVWDDGLPPIDSIKFRSAGAMINHAFPNAVNNNLYAHEQKGVDGALNRRIITAINDIAAGEQITPELRRVYMARRSSRTAPQCYAQVY